MRAWGSTGAPEREAGWTMARVGGGGDVKLLLLLFLLLLPWVSGAVLLFQLLSAAAASARVVVAVAASEATAKVGERESDDGVSWACGASSCGGWAWCSFCRWWPSSSSTALR